MLAVIGAVAWLIRLEARLGTLQVLFEQHVSEKNMRLQQIVLHLERLEHKVDLIRMRCLAFHHSDAPSLMESDAPPGA